MRGEEEEKANERDRDLPGKVEYKVNVRKGKTLYAFLSIFLIVSDNEYHEYHAKKHVRTKYIF